MASLAPRLYVPVYAEGYIDTTAEQVTLAAEQAARSAGLSVPADASIRPPWFHVHERGEPVRPGDEPNVRSVEGFRPDPLRDSIWQAIRLRLYDTLLHHGANGIEIEGSLHNSAGMPPYVTRRLKESKLSSAAEGAKLEHQLATWLAVADNTESRRVVRKLAYFLGACIVANRAGASLVFPLQTINLTEVVELARVSFAPQVSIPLVRTLTALRPDTVNGLTHQYESAIPFESIAEDVLSSPEFSRYARDYGLLRSSGQDIGETKRHIGESAKAFIRRFRDFVLKDTVIHVVDSLATLATSMSGLPLTEPAFDLLKTVTAGLFPRNGKRLVVFDLDQLYKVDWLFLAEGQAFRLARSSSTTSPNRH